MSDSRKNKNIEDYISRIRIKQSGRHDIDQLYSGIVDGDKSSLSEAITLVESRRTEDIPIAYKLLQKCLNGKNAMRIGITGTPGVGKSTFIDTYARSLADQGRKIAILSIDPSSYISRGSILGDKTRMDSISSMENVYIRPSATGETLGGVHERTRETILLCEAAGYDHIIVETVGVGQSEYFVQRMTDVMVLMLLPGSGDELQGIKKGIMEAADIILVNKEDVFKKETMSRTITDYQHALHHSSRQEGDWTVRIQACNATDPASVAKADELLEEYFRHAGLKGKISSRRREQWEAWFADSLGTAVQDIFKLEGDEMRSYLPADDELPPAKAYHLVRSLFRKRADQS